MSAEAVTFTGNETRANNPVPIEHLDYAYIDKCNDAKEVERILKVLRSGKEGLFPHLTEYCEGRLAVLAPQSRALWVAKPALTAASLPPDERAQLQHALDDWNDEMRMKEEAIKTQGSSEAGMGDFLPPVRKAHDKTDIKKSVMKDIQAVAQRRICSVDYKAWDRYDVEAECVRLDTANDEGDSRPPPSDKPTTNPPDLALDINALGMSHAELEIKAEREKEKGNDAFRAGDFAEALVYYTRSISVLPCAACYNNRALVHIKQRAWDSALRDCNTVLGLEPNNVKALLRRALAYREQGQDASARSDLLRVLELDEHNAQAQALLRKVACDDGVRAAERREAAPSPTLGPQEERRNLADHPESASLGKKRVTLQIQMEDDEVDEDLPGAQSGSGAPPSAAQHAGTVVPTAALPESSVGSPSSATTAFRPRSGTDSLAAAEPVPPSAYEFGQRWRRLAENADAGTEGAASLLRSVEPDRLPLLVSNRLESADVALLARAVARHVLPGEPGTAFLYLQRLTRAPRFQVACSFLTNSEKEMIRHVMKQLTLLSSGKYTQEDVHTLEEQYGI